MGFRALENARIVAERGHVGQQSPLPGGLELSVGYVDFTLSVSGVRKPYDVPQLISAEPLTVQLPGVTLLADGWRMVATWLTVGEAPIDLPKGNALEAMLALPIDAALQMRPRVNGEKMRPLGMEGKSRKIKDIMIDEKIPQTLRQKWPVLVLDDKPVWLVGHKVDESMRVSAEAETVLHLKLLSPASRKLK